MESLVVFAIVVGIAPSLQDEGGAEEAFEWEVESGFLSPNIGLGPFRGLSVAPLASLRPGFFPVPPSNLPRGSFELHETEDWANVWSVNGSKFFLDYEVLVSEVSLAYGIDDGLRVEFAFVDGARFGGTLDPLIIGTHRLVGARQKGRTDFPENDFRYELDPGNGRPAIALDNGERGSYAQAIEGTAQYTFAGERGGPPALSGALTLRREVGESELRGGSPLDVALSLSSAIGFGDFYAYLGAGAAWFGHERFHGLALRAMQYSGLAAIEWNFVSWLSFIVRYQLIEGGLNADGPFSRPSHESTIGFKIEPWRNVLVEVAMIENHVNPYNSADFGFHLGVAIRW